MNYFRNYSYRELAEEKHDLYLDLKTASFSFQGLRKATELCDSLSSNSSTPREGEMLFH